MNQRGGHRYALLKKLFLEVHTLRPSVLQLSERSAPLQNQLYTFIFIHIPIPILYMMHEWHMRRLHCSVTVISDEQLLRKMT